MTVFLDAATIEGERMFVSLEPKPILQKKKAFCPRREPIGVKIAVCDDDRGFVKTMRRMLCAYAQAFQYVFEIEGFCSAEALLASPRRFDLVFLDYRLGNMNGFDAACTLRQRRAGCAIIFVTAHTHFMQDAFTVNAFRFLLKPLSEETLFDALDAYFDTFGNDYALLLRCEKETIELNTADILYLEADNKHCVIHWRDRAIHCTKTMAVVSQLLPRDHFCRIHRAYTVNLDYMQYFGMEYALLKNGERLPIGCRYQDSARQTLSDYKRLERKRTVVGV